MGIQLKLCRKRCQKVGIKLAAGGVGRGYLVERRIRVKVNISN